VWQAKLNQDTLVVAVFVPPCRLCLICLCNCCLLISVASAFTAVLPFSRFYTYLSRYIYIRFRFYIFFPSERHANSDLFRLSRPSPCPLRLLQSSKDPRIQVANGNLASVSSTPCCPSTPAIALVLSANEEPCFWPSKSGMNLNVECTKQIKHPIYYTRYLITHVFRKIELHIL